jgi:hypothetical protein
LKALATPTFLFLSGEPRIALVNEFDLQIEGFATTGNCFVNTEDLLEFAYASLTTERVCPLH